MPLRAIGALTFGIATLTAQSASYTLFGEGCNGSPVTNAVTQNDQNMTLTVRSLPNEYAYAARNTTAQPIQIVGFEIYSVSNTAQNETGNTWILLDNSGPGATTFTTPASTPSAFGSITVTPTQGWYSTPISPPITIAPNEVFWVGAESYSRLAPPDNANGTAGPASSYYRRPSNGMVWTPSVTVAHPAFRVHCVSATPPAPALNPVSPPVLGQTLSLQIGNGTPSLPAFLMFGISDQSWATLPLPLDLAVFGAPNCWLFTSADTMLLVMLDGSGSHTFAAPLPNNAGLMGFTFFNQVAALVPGANALSMLTSNAGRGVIGM